MHDKSNWFSATVAVSILLVSSVSMSFAQECGDLDNSGAIVTTDALLVLRKAVGQPVALSCPPSGLMPGRDPILPRTGQTTCYDSAGSAIPCAGTGQDGEVQAGRPRTFTNNGDGTITDEATGLMWEVQCTGPHCSHLHDKDIIYNWPEAFTQHIATLNLVNFAGHNDWRLPNIVELLSLVDDETSDLTIIDPEVFPAFDACAADCDVTMCSCTNASGCYWSSTTFLPVSPDAAWVVCFQMGDSAGAAAKFSSVARSMVRAVRGGLPTPAALATAAGSPLRVSGPSECGDLDGSGSIVTTDALLVLERAVGQPVNLTCPSGGLTPGMDPILPRTGQTTCYDFAGTQINCAGTGQDGEVQAGQARTFTNNGDGTITDDATGLMWEAKCDGPSCGALHDQDTEYDWDQAFSAHVATLNIMNFAGHNDWRLPNVTELRSLVKYESMRQTMAVYSAFNACAADCDVTSCNCTRHGSFWPSTTDPLFSDSVLDVDFVLGLVDSTDKTRSLHQFVRAVRGGL